MTAVDEIKNRLDIVDVVSQTVSLRKSGRNFSGFCPFHHNTRTPSFYVFPETQTWHCFGACSEGGDLFSFVMKRDNLDFKEALETLAPQAGVDLEAYRGSGKKKDEGMERQLGLLAAAVDYFHMLFLHAPEAAAARDYVAGRALSEETIAVFKLGFAQNRWDAIRTHFLSQGYTEDELLAVGLLTENQEKGTRYDRFRNRLMIPIQNLSGEWVGFGARTLEPDGIPKYLNSPQTAVFDKSNLLFGMHEAKRHIRTARQVVIVEGYMDVMQAWQSGFRNVVAQMGTALTEEQLQQLKRLTKRFVLALDADAAGAKATMRSLQVARETLDRDVSVRFDARGLVLHEGKLQADIRVVTLPVGKDPDNIIRETPAAWPTLLEQAKPIVQYVIDVATADLNRDDPKAKTAVAQQVIPLIKEIDNPVERDHYWQALARALQTTEKALRQVPLPVKRQRQPFVPPGQTMRASVPPPPNFETVDKRPAHRQKGARTRQSYFLGQCLHYSWLLARVNQKLAENEQPVLHEDDFASSEDRAVFRQLGALTQTLQPVAAASDLWDSLDDVVLARVDELRTTTPAPKVELDHLADKLTLMILTWRQEKMSRMISEIQQMFRPPQQIDDDESQTMVQQLLSLKQQMLSVHRAKDAMSASSRGQVRGGNGR